MHGLTRNPPPIGPMRGTARARSSDCMDDGRSAGTWGMGHGACMDHSARRPLVLS
jgi:hypothetical protein